MSTLTADMTSGLTSGSGQIDATTTTTTTQEGITTTVARDLTTLVPPTGGDTPHLLFQYTLSYTPSPL